MLRTDIGILSSPSYLAVRSLLVLAVRRGLYIASDFQIAWLTRYILQVLRRDMKTLSEAGT